MDNEDLQKAFNRTTLESRILRGCQTPITSMTKSWMKEIEFTSKLLKSVITLAIEDIEEKKEIYYDH